MRFSRWRWLPLAASFLFLTLALCHSWQGPDIWYHLTWGRQIVEYGRIWPHQQTLLVQPVPANVYWIFQAALYTAFKFGGIGLVSGLFILVWLTIATIWLKVSKASSRPLIGGWLFLAFVLCAQTRFEHRPEVFSYLLILLAWRFPGTRLGRGLSSRTPKGAFGLSALWANLHGFFPLGVLMSGAWWTTRFPDRTPRRSMALLYIPAAMLAATFIGPAGPRVWLAVWQNMKVAAGLNDVNAELFPPAFWPLTWQTSVFWGWWVLILWLVTRAFRDRRSRYFALLGLAGVLLSLQAVRYAPLLVLMGAPLLRRLPRRRVRPAMINVSAGLCTVVALVGCWSVVSGTYARRLDDLSSFGIGLEWASYPIGAVRWLQEASFKGRVFTDSYDGGYVEFHLPDSLVAGDSYFSDPATTRELFAATREPKELLALDQKFHFDALLINVENLETVDAALSWPGWRLVYADSHRALFMRAKESEGQTFPRPNFSAFSYYQGQDLRDWKYAFGPISWTALAIKRGEYALMFKVISDISPSPAVPSTLVRLALQHGIRTRDERLLREVQGLEAKIHLVEKKDERLLADLWAKAKECCH